MITCNNATASQAKAHPHKHGDQKLPRTAHSNKIYLNGMQAWEVKSAEARLIIIIKLCEDVVAKMRAILDNNAKELTKRTFFYTRSTHEAITNLIIHLSALLFDKKTEL